MSKLIPVSPPLAVPVRTELSNAWRRFVDVWLDAEPSEPLSSCADLRLTLTVELHAEEIRVPGHGSVRVGLLETDLHLELTDLETCGRRFPPIQRMADLDVEANVVEAERAGSAKVGASLDPAALTALAMGAPSEQPAVTLTAEKTAPRPKVTTYPRRFETIRLDRRIRADGGQAIIHFSLSPDHKLGGDAHLRGACLVSFVASPKGEHPALSALCPPVRKRRYRIINDNLSSAAPGRLNPFRVIFVRALEAELARLGTIHVARWELAGG